jgi:hypothetical protein
VKIVLSAPVPAFTQEFRSGRQGEAGGKKGFWSLALPRPLPVNKIGSPRTSLLRKFNGVKIFSNAHRKIILLILKKKI